MRAYADTSFILRLVITEAGSAETISEFRRLGTPRLFFLPLHALEARNGILLRTFHQRRLLPSNERRHVERDRDAAFDRIEVLLKRRTLMEVSLDFEAALEEAKRLAGAHTERIGARSIDALHVACALILKAERFLTTDDRQAQLARAEGLTVVRPVVQTCSNVF